MQIVKGTTPTEYKPYFKHTTDIPLAVQQLDGYGVGINADCYNYFERTDDKVLFHKRVGSVDLGSLSWNRSGTLHYFSSSISNEIKKLSNNDEKAVMICNRYGIDSLNNITIRANDNVIGTDISGYVRVYDSRLTSTDINVIKEYLSGVPQ